MSDPPGGGRHYDQLGAFAEQKVTLGYFRGAKGNYERFAAFSSPDEEGVGPSRTTIALPLASIGFSFVDPLIFRPCRVARPMSREGKGARRSVLGEGGDWGFGAALGRHRFVFPALILGRGPIRQMGPTGCYCEGKLWVFPGDDLASLARALCRSTAGGSTCGCPFCSLVVGVGLNKRFLGHGTVGWRRGCEL